MSFTAGSTGGEYKHTLTVNEIPSHNHKNFFVNGTTVGWTDKAFQQGALGGVRPNRTSDITTGYTGSGQSHNNIQPYIAVYFWQRTS